MSRYQQLVNESSNSSQEQQQQQLQQQQPKEQEQQFPRIPQTQTQPQSQTQEPSVGYHLYMLREQLGRRKCEYMRLSKAKYFITETLLAKTVCNLKGCTIDELKTVNNQIVFKHKLRHQIHRLRKLQSLGYRNPNPNMESTEL